MEDYRYTKYKRTGGENMIDDCYGYNGCNYCPNPCDDILRQREEDD